MLRYKNKSIREKKINNFVEATIFFKKKIKNGKKKQEKSKQI